MQENDTTVESNLQICSPLLAQAIDSLVADGVASREKIEKLLNEDLFQQDLFRSLIMEEILFAKSQIRLLLADYRESWGKRFVFYGASGLLIILSGIGFFDFFRVLGG